MLLLGDDTHDNGRVPWVTGGIGGLCVLVFLWQGVAGPSFTLGFSMIPYELTHLKDLTKTERIKVKQPVHVHYVKGKSKVEYRETYVSVPQAPGPFPIFLTLFTSMFMHGGWFHLIGNMWFLVLFGRNVECALGHGRFALFYIACGVVGGLVYTLTDLNSVIPCLGASGAISGVMGAYVAIYPLNMVKVWLGWYLGVVRVPAIVVVGVWFLFQYMAAFDSLEGDAHNMGGVAYWDHIGGFLAGLAIVRGMVVYLRWKSAHQPPEEDTMNAADELEAADKPRASDPFANFLPPALVGQTRAPTDAPGRE